jgi:truncated hemoglobin YjbI
VSDVYERLGGPLAVEELVARLDQRLLLDPRLAGLFEGVDLASLARHQHEVIVVLLRGEGDDRGSELRQAHAGLELDETHFAVFLEHLAHVLTVMGTPRDVADEVLATCAGLRADIVGG